MSIAKTKILIIEDDEFTRAIIRQALVGLGFMDIEEAEDGGRGLASTLRHLPDLVFCDIHMKPVDGLYYLNELRNVRHEEIANTPVVFLTANAKQKMVLQAQKLHVNGYMIKPVSPGDLKRQIRRILHLNFS